MRTNEQQQKTEEYSYYALMATKIISNNFENWNMQTPSNGTHSWTAKYMKYGHNKQFKILQTNSCCHTLQNKWRCAPMNQKDTEDYSYYALMATKSMSNNFQNWNMQTPSHGKHFWRAKSMKYGHIKQFKILQSTAAAMPCEINDGAHQRTTKEFGRLFILCYHGNWAHEH